MRWRFATVMLGSLLSLAVLAPSVAHDGIKHSNTDAARAHLEQNRSKSDDSDGAFVENLGGAFLLTDQSGAARSQQDPDGHLQLLFFGYANCQAICSVALPKMAAITDLAAKAGIQVRPILVTVDPKRDTPEAMVAPLAALHDQMVGLTGSEEALAQIRSLFQVERKLVFEDPKEGPIYAHGSFIYLLDADGKVLTLIPPILSADRGAEIVAKYAAS